MRINMKGISISKNVYDALNELRQQYNMTFGEVISKYIPQPFFEAPISVSYPVEKKEIQKKIPKKKYNYTADLEDFNKNKCKSLNLSPMKPPRKKQVLKADYTEEVKDFIIETAHPYVQAQYKNKKKVKSA
jgi:predicted CopG family antitoxin